MKHFNNRGYGRLLGVLVWLLAAAPGARAQGGDALVTGETQVLVNQPYAYRHNYGPVTGVYWHIEGAATINGTVANLVPDGNVDAAARSIEITWSWLKTSHVQLRRGTGADVRVLAST